jgi:hypothetical protein
MAHPLSHLGILHTAISLIPIAAGLANFIRLRRIDPASRAGRIYVWGLTASVLTAFGLSSTGGFNAGHALGILALLAVFGAWWAQGRVWLGRARPYLSTFGFSLSFFLLMVPGINETLTRLPASHPLAAGPESPVVQTALATWLGLFLLGFALQCWWTAARANRSAGSASRGARS